MRKEQSIPRYFAIGTIRYDQIDPLATAGILVYIKNSLTGDEPSDVSNYARRHPTFPHQATADQFFTESQFESYRALGSHVARAVFSDAMRGVEWTEQMEELTHERVVTKLFSNLHRRWFPPPSRLEKNYLDSVKSCIDAIAAIRQDKNLSELCLDMFPEPHRDISADNIPNKVGQRQAHRIDCNRPDQDENGKTRKSLEQARAELHMAEQILEVMESAWLTVGLEGFQAHPTNRGWLNAFRRWSNSSVLKQHWLTLRGEYRQDFVRFCEDTLRLDRGATTAYSYRAATSNLDPAQWNDFRQELAAEWPGEDLLETVFERVQTIEVNGQVVWPAWLIASVSFDDPDRTHWTGDKLLCGVLVVTTPSENDEPYELYLWIRGPYRNLGIGRDCSQQLEDIVQGLSSMAPGKKIQVCLPNANRPGSPNTNQRGMWLSYFYQYEFRRPTDVQRRAASDLILERPLDA